MKRVIGSEVETFGGVEKVCGIRRSAHNEGWCWLNRAKHGQSSCGVLSVGAILMRRHILTMTLSCLILAGLTVGSLRAAITADQRKELKEIGSDLSKIASLVSKKKYEDAGTAIQAAEERLTKFMEDAGLKQADPALRAIHVQLEKAKTLLDKANSKGAAKGGVNFGKQIAPILVSKCISCHSDEPKGGLNISTFADMKKGGKSGDLWIPGNAEESLLVQRLIIENDGLRMPKGKEALPEKDVRLIGTWIAEGAKFTGEDTAALAELAKAATSTKPVAAPPKVEIVKETGKETVHFMKDLMPELVDTCGRCHNDTVKRKGFSVMSFEKVMKGGDSGAVIVGGSPENSRLWRLVNGDDTPVMPAGNQTGVTRPWYNNLKTWILEGATFDGDDAKKNFPSREERDAAALAKFTPEQWLERRKKASAADWKKTIPSVEPKQRESAEFLLYGDVSEERLEQVEKWASEQVASLRQIFKIKDEPLWKGKLALFVFKERFGYEEFNKSVQKRDVERDVIGHSHLTSTMEEAFVALQDVGDSATESSPGMQVNLIEHITGAFLKRGGGGLPEWLIRGTGLALAHRKATGNPFLATMPRIASGILQESTLTEPEKIFVNGTFSPSEIGPIGITLVEFLLKKGDVGPFNLFVQKLKSGSSAEEAIKASYHVDGKALAVAYASSLPSSGKKGKK
jgi:mono/diheme cytochrome c family protein